MIADDTMAPAGTELEQMTPDELKDWRTRHDSMTQAELARRLEVSLGTIRKYEQGERRIPAFMWRALRDLERELAEKGTTDAR